MNSNQRRRAAVVTVSDGVSRGVREDASGRAVVALLEAEGFEVTERDVVPDERDRIASVLRLLADRGVPLVVTTGGTGFGPRDVTPEATRDVIDREAPGLAEEMRAAGRASTPLAALSRGIAGSRGSTLVVNLPGSERGAIESLRAILPALPHALDLLGGDTVHGPEGTTAPTAPMPATAPVPPGSSRGIEQELAARLVAGEEVVVATAIATQGDPPCRIGQKMLLGRGGALAGTLGCAEFDDGAVADAPTALSEAGPIIRTYTHDLGTVEILLEPHTRPPTLLVFSATPVALHLMRWGRDIGFEPILVEPRHERVRPEHRAAGRVETSLDGVAIDGRTTAVHTDHDAPGVAESVASLLRSPAAFIGVMGSARHVGPHVERLREQGFSERDLARVRTPVGVDIGARSAEEIALSILAGLVAAGRGVEPKWLDRGR